MVLLPAALVMTLIINSGWSSWEFMWSYSLWLEAVAFIPQIWMLNKIRIIENITSNYVATLGLYRFFYILNWIYRYYVDDFYCWTQILSGVLQTGFYVDFLYYYYVSVREGKPVIELPMWLCVQYYNFILNIFINIFTHYFYFTWGFGVLGL